MKLADIQPEEGKKFDKYEMGIAQIMSLFHEDLPVRLRTL